MSTVHVLPLNDVVAHHVPGGLDYHDHDRRRVWLVIEAAGNGDDQGCVCQPAVECVPRDNGPDGWIVTHHSLDGREWAERAQRRAELAHAPETAKNAPPPEPKL